MQVMNSYCGNGETLLLVIRGFKVKLANILRTLWQKKRHKIQVALFVLVKIQDGK